MHEEKRRAVIFADGLLELLIKSQPTLTSTVVSEHNAAGGKKLGEFIEALRDQFIGMYEKTPKP